MTARKKTRYFLARWLPVCLLLAAPSIFSHAATMPKITTIGGGGDACRKWTEAQKEPGARAQYKQWLFGFVSGYNWRDPSRQIEPTDGDTLVTWVDAFCKTNPAEPIFVAAGNLAKRMSKPVAPPRGAGGK